MTTQDLIAELSKFPPNTKVVLFDWRKHSHYASLEPNSVGAEFDFKIEYSGERLPEPHVALIFENDDYDTSGELCIPIPNLDFNMLKHFYDWHTKEPFRMNEMQDENLRIHRYLSTASKVIATNL